MTQQRTVQGVGYLGEGNYSCKSHRYVYNAWAGMLMRCYDKKYQSKRPTYIGCTVAQRWHNFQNFASDYLQMVGSDKGWELDKDILIRGNKHYSRRRCCLVPTHVNSLLISCTAARGRLPLGVTRASKAQGYMAQCRVNGKRLYLGRYATPERAFRAYRKVKEPEIRRVAREVRDEVDPRVYKVLRNYKIVNEISR